MKKNCHYSIFLITLLLSGCHQIEKRNFFHIKNPEKKSALDFPLSEICSDIQYIKLDSIIPLAGIRKIEFDHDIIVLQDKIKGIIKFDKTGKFLSQIGSIGKGPGEYSLTYSKFTIGNNGKNVYVLDHFKDVLVFDENNQYTNKFSINGEIIANDVFSISQNRLLFASGNPTGDFKYKWIVTDNSGKMIYTKKNSVNFKIKKGAGPLPAQIIFKRDSIVYYFEQYNDTIFQIGPDSFKTFGFFDLGKYRLTPEIAERDGLFNAGNSYLIPLNIYETRKYLIIEYIYKNFKMALFNKETEELNIINNCPAPKRLLNDFDSGLPFSPISEFNNHLTCVVNPFELKKHVASDAFKNSTPKFPEKKKELEKLANSLNENDNPVLMLVKLKE